MMSHDKTAAAITADRRTHTATIIQAGTAGWQQASPAEGFIVQCPHGCNLGTSAQAADREAAERRVRLHELSTAAAAAARRPPRPRLTQDGTCDG